MGFIERGMKIGLAGSILASAAVGEAAFVKNVAIPSFHDDGVTQQASRQLKDKEHELLLADPADISGRRGLQQEIRTLEETRDNNDQGLLPVVYLAGAVGIAFAGVYGAAGAHEGVSEVSSRIRRRAVKAQESPTT